MYSSTHGTWIVVAGSQAGLGERVGGGAVSPRVVRPPRRNPSPGASTAQQRQEQWSLPGSAVEGHPLEPRTLFTSQVLGF